MRAVRVLSLKEKNRRVRHVEKVLKNPSLYEEKVRKLIEYLDNNNKMPTILSLQEEGIIEINYNAEYEVLQITQENKPYAKKILLKYYDLLFGRDVLAEERQQIIEEEARDRVGRVFTTIIVERRCGVEVFHPFVLELYNTWTEVRAGETGTIYGVLKEPTFMGELLAKYILEGNSNDIDFTDKQFPLKETVAKHYFGRLWSQKMLFLELLQKLREKKKITRKLIEQFVDKTFGKESKKKRFIIQAFVEMAKNRGFELGRIPPYLQERAEKFISSIGSEPFSEELTESEIMQGVEGFNWNMGYQKKPVKKIARTQNREQTISEQEDHAARTRSRNPAPSGNSRYHFAELVAYLKEQGKHEISLPELTKLMEEFGYRRTKILSNSDPPIYLFPNTTTNRLIGLLEKKYKIRVIDKESLSSEEEKHVREWAKNQYGDREGKKIIQFKEIRNEIIKNGRFSLSYFSKPTVEACALLLIDGYFIEGIGRDRLNDVIDTVARRLEKTGMDESKMKEIKKRLGID